MRFDKEMTPYIDTMGLVLTHKDKPSANLWLTCLYNVLSYQSPFTLSFTRLSVGQEVPGFIHAHDMFVAGVKPSLTLRLEWAIRVLFGTMFRLGPTAELESWLMVYALASNSDKKKYRVCLGIARIWYMIKMRNGREAFALRVSKLMETGHPLAAHFDPKIKDL